MCGESAIYCQRNLLVERIQMNVIRDTKQCVVYHERFVTHNGAIQIDSIRMYLCAFVTFIFFWHRQNSNCGQIDHELNKNIKLRTLLHIWLRCDLQRKNAIVTRSIKTNVKKEIFSIDEKKEQWFVNSRLNWVNWVDCTAK